MIFACLDEREEDAARMSTDIIAMEKPVFSANNERFYRALTAIIVNFKAPIFKVAIKCRPQQV